MSEDWAGRRTLLVGPDDPDVRATRDLLRASGATVILDREEDRSSTELVAAAAARMDGLDVLVRWTPRPPPDTAWDDAAFGEDIDRMLVGAHHLASDAVRAMARPGGAGHPAALVFVGTVDARHAYPGRVSASAGMSGLVGLVRALGAELASRTVRVNAVLVGPLGDVRGGPPSDVPEALIERVRIRLPASRFVTPQEVATAIAFVAGPKAGFMTGQSVAVDGGWSSLDQAPEGLRFP
jgi:3-oxoacyl-[acyl-carrier protein] reductase